MLVVTSNKTFASRIRAAAPAMPQLALSFRKPPGVTVSVNDLLLGTGARLVAVDAALFDRGLVTRATVCDAAEPTAEVLLLFDEVGESAVELSLMSHAHGCLEYDVVPEAFLRAVAAVANNHEFWFPRWMMEPFYDMALEAANSQVALLAAEHRDASKDLTEREFEVIRLVRRGHTNKEVAQQLGISPNTVKKHVHNALNKHGILRRRQLFR